MWHKVATDTGSGSPPPAVLAWVAHPRVSAASVGFQIVHGARVVPTRSASLDLATWPMVGASLPAHALRIETIRAPAKGASFHGPRISAPWATSHLCKFPPSSRGQFSSV